MPSPRHRDLDEDAFRSRFVGDVEFRTSRTGFGDASVVTYRFPCQGAARLGPDFVLIHGIGVSARSFGPTAAELSARGEVHLLDLPGYGRSPRPDRDLSIADHAAIVANYLDQKNLDRPVLVGHSMGTQVAAQLAADFPDLVEHLVLIGPVVPPQSRSLLKLAGLLLADGRNEPPSATATAVVDYFRAGLPYLAQQLPHMLAADLDAIARQVSAKTLVIRGQEDPIVPHEWARCLAGRFRNGWFATVPGPHGSMFAEPQRVTALIDEHADR